MLLFEARSGNGAGFLFCAMKNNNNYFWGMAIAILSANLFSSKVLLVKFAYTEGASPLQVLCLRMAAALPVFALVTAFLIWKYPQKRPGKADLLAIVVLGLVGYYLSSLLDFHGIQYLSAGLERLLLYLYPTFLVLIRSIATKSIPSKREIIALGLAYAGTALVYFEEQLQYDTQVLKGVLLVISAAFSFAVYLYFSHGYIRRFGSPLFASISSLVSCVAILVHATISRSMDVSVLSPVVISSCLALGIFCTVIPTFSMHFAIAKIGSAKVGMLGTTGLLAPFVLGAVYFGEEITLIKVFGAALILVSVLVLSSIPHD